MTARYGSYSEDFYVNLNLNTEMELPSNRESVLHFFEQMQKKYPSMTNFYNRDRSENVLEEEKSSGKYRWVTVETKRISSGYVNPGDLADAMEQHLFVTELLPYDLSVRPIDCSYLSLMYGFDFTYRGNHNELVAEALGLPVAFDKLATMENAKGLSYEPAIQFTLDEQCKTQCRLSIETRTTASQIRANEFGDDQISVYLTARHFGSLKPNESFTAITKTLQGHVNQILDNSVVEHVLIPLQHAIACK